MVAVSLKKKIFFKQKTAYEIPSCDWSSDVCSSDLVERSMIMNGRLDGHIVQGHVDETAKCIATKDADGSTYFTFEYELNKEMARKGYFTVDKGSVTVNGVSLTVCEPTDNTFTVAIIPYTRENTNFCNIEVGTVVNIEFDILGKYIARLKSFE